MSVVSPSSSSNTVVFCGEMYSCSCIHETLYWQGPRCKFLAQRLATLTVPWHCL